MITLSVVTTTYNVASVPQPTSDSVLMQDRPHVEHIIIDGASTDNTLEIAKACQQLSNEVENEYVVRIQSESDKGLYDAMNKGLQQVTGDYIVFMNVDDCFPNLDTLDKVVLTAVVGNGEELPAVLFGDTDITDEKDNFINHRRLSPSERLTWRSFRYGVLVCHQTFHARLDIAHSLLYDTAYRCSADADWYIRVMKEGERQQLLLRNIHAAIANYVREGQTTRHHKESLRERFDVMCKHHGLIQTVSLHAWFVVRGSIKWVVYLWSKCPWYVLPVVKGGNFYATESFYQ